MEEHQGGADLSHRVTATLRLSVHVRGGRLSGQLSRRHDLIIVSQAATEVVWAHARDQKLSRKLFGDASLLEYTCCWHPDPEGGVVVGGKEGAVEEEAAVQVYLAERQRWDMHSARLQLRLPRPRKVASHVSITTEAFAFLKKHDDCASNDGGDMEEG